MKEFLLILLLGRAVLLTSTPVDLSKEWLEIPLEKPISAINSGATLNVQISTNGKIIGEIGDANDQFQALKKIVPDETIDAILSDADGNQVRFTNTGFSISDYTFSRDDSVWITLNNMTSLPSGKKYEVLRIKSKKNIQDVSIVWKNYKK